VTSDQVRDYLTLNTPGSSSRYSDDTINSNIQMAQSMLENETHRFLADHPGVTWAATTLNRAQVAIPGFRSFASIVWGASEMTISVPGDGVVNPSVWGLWESSPGVEDGKQLVVALQFRPWRVDNDRPWYYADPLWWDKALDNPFYPGNWGGGYAWTSMPNDLVIVGDGGYAPGDEPWQLKEAVRAMAAWITMRPASLFANVAATPAGGSLPYWELPPEVNSFIDGWKAAEQATSVG
jgi:hypothetical protein